MMGTGVQDPEIQALNRLFGVQIAALPLTSYIVLDKLFNLSTPVFSFAKADNNVHAS